MTKAGTPERQRPEGNNAGRPDRRSARRREGGKAKRGTVPVGRVGGRDCPLFAWPDGLRPKFRVSSFEFRVGKAQPEGGTAGDAAFSYRLSALSENAGMQKEGLAAGPRNGGKAGRLEIIHRTCRSGFGVPPLGGPPMNTKKRESIMRSKFQVPSFKLRTQIPEIE